MNEYTVLCVDDDEAIRELYEVAFMSWGHCAITAGSGSQALDVLSKRVAGIDAVVVDYEMPGMNGAELAAEIKLKNPSLPVLMVSGNSEILHRIPPFVDAALAKGSDLELILDQIEQLLAPTGTPKPAERVRWTIAGSASA